MLTLCGGLFVEVASVLSLPVSLPLGSASFRLPTLAEPTPPLLELSWPCDSGSDEVPVSGPDLKRHCIPLASLGTCPAATKQPGLSLLKEKRPLSSRDELFELRPSETS